MTSLLFWTVILERGNAFFATAPHLSNRSELGYSAVAGIASEYSALYSANLCDIKKDMPFVISKEKATKEEVQTTPLNDLSSTERRNFMTPNAAVHTLMHWLEDHRDQSLLIHKHEQEDSDHVLIRLTDVDFKPGTVSIDGYTNESALWLHGEGTVLNDGQTLPLPQNAYVIPIAGLLFMAQS